MYAASSRNACDNAYNKVVADGLVEIRAADGLPSAGVVVDRAAAAVGPVAVVADDLRLVAVANDTSGDEHGVVGRCAEGGTSPVSG